MAIEGILAELEFNEGYFPRIALKRAIARREEITPYLLEILEYAANNAEELLEEESYFAHIHAMFLLAQFREKRAYPLIAKFFSIPGETSLDLTGDIVTENLKNILASVSCGDMSLMMEMAENEEANEFVRGAALQAPLILVACGEKSLEEVKDYYASLFRGKLKREPNHIWDALIHCCAELCLEELYEDVKQAFEEDLVDTAYIDLKDVDRHIATGKEDTLANLRHSYNRYNLIEDTIKAMEWWACFKSPELPQPKKKIGRNDPCPCGSGKKYKKCCIDK